MNTRLKDIYDKKIVTTLMTKLKYKNRHQVPKLLKVILNMGLGSDASDSKKVKACVEDMSIFKSFKNFIFLSFRFLIITDFCALVSNPFLEKTTKIHNFNIFL